MSIKINLYAIISKDGNYGKRLRDDLVSMCGENGCHFAFRIFTDVRDLQDSIGLDGATHIILVMESGGSHVVQELRSAEVHAPIMLLTNSTADMQALFRQVDAYAAHPPQSKEDLACIMNLLYGDDNRFLPEGRRLQISPMLMP